jgi:GNAT superfamily N-acetyltransferase
LATKLEIRGIKKIEYDDLGQLMSEVYSKLEGFPGPDEQPAYYEMLANIGSLSEKENTEVLVANSPELGMMGGVAYFSDMAVYGSGGTATLEKNASGFRLLGVSPKARGLGAGKALSLACINKARAAGHSQIIIHTTQSMQLAWRMYENLGFVRSPDLDFMQEDLPVFGFRLTLE